MNAIEIQGLTRDYGQGRGVFDIGFAVQRGEAFGFLGPNGAGKTTTIRHLMGFLQPQKGRCAVLGQDCWKQSVKVQQSLGYIPGEMAFPEDMTGQGFLAFLARYRGMKGPGRTRELLDRFDLNPSGRLKRMSKGMRQKVGIVAAFQHDPEVLILDEPTSGLDPLMQNRFIELIAEEKKRGKTLLMSSHMFEEVERTCHRVAIIRDGKLATVDSIDTLKAAQVRKYIVTLADEAAAEAFTREPDLETVWRTQNHVTVLVRNNLAQFIAAMHRHPVTNLAAPNQSLEEVFLQYYGGKDQHERNAL